MTSDIACLIYKQTILPIAEYADLVVDSSPTQKNIRLQRLQDKAIRIVDNRQHRNLDIDIVSNLYRISPLNTRRAEHLCLLMYRLKDDPTRKETSRPSIHLKGRNKIKLKRYREITRNIFVVFFLEGSLCGTEYQQSQFKGQQPRLSLNVILHLTYPDAT